jgi:hypothetical protein
VEVMKKNFVVILVLLFIMILISGCMNILPTQEEDLITLGKGRLKIYLTDTPGDYLEVNITISKIEAHIAGEDEGAEGYWIVLKEWGEGEEPEFDLITLQDVSELLVDGIFEIGKYTQLRIFVTKSFIKVEMEETVEENTKEIEVLSEVPFEVFDVEIPSVYQTGIKLIHPFEIIEGKTTELTMDFDAEKSIVKTGKGNYKLKPVIKIVTGSTDENGEEE